MTDWNFNVGDRAIVNKESSPMYRGKGVTIASRDNERSLVYWCMLDDRIPPFPQMFNQWELEPYIDSESLDAETKQLNIDESK